VRPEAPGMSIRRSWWCAMACDFCFGNEATGEFHGL
jgi:hypothetical protein